LSKNHNVFEFVKVAYRILLVSFIDKMYISVKVSSLY